ncbi:MAG: hypothetical protein ACKO0M_18630 [Cyanobium sp.]
MTQTQRTGETEGGDRPAEQLRPGIGPTRPHGSGSDGIQSGRLRERARLLEFLKFRVLASQEAFFEAWRPDGATATMQEGGLPRDLDLQAFRLWLTHHWPAAARLDDSDLRHSLEQAHHLYVDSLPRPGPSPLSR